MSPGSLADSVRLAARLSSELAEYAVSIEDSVPPEVGATEALTPEDQLLGSFDERITDTDLRQAARSRFVSTHYSDAVEAGVKILNECIRARTGRTEDGDGLMTVVFSPAKPLLRLNRLKSKADESAQRGHMFLCQGVVAAWRNPRAHDNLDDAPQKALMMLETINELILVSKAAVRTRQRRKP